MNKVVKTILTIAIILVVVVLIAWPKVAELRSNSNEPKQASVNTGSNAIPVKGMVVKPERLDNKIRVTGAVLANESLDLRTEIPGIVSNIYFDEGNQVKKGQVLLNINVDILKAELEKLKYTQQLSMEIENRQKQLLEREAISQQEYDISLTQFNTSAADIKVLEEQIAKSVIRSPFDGAIGLRYISEGSYITPETRIAYLVKVDPAKIDFSVPGRYAGEVQEGDEISFTVEGMEEEFIGTVYAKDPRIDPITRTLPIRAISSNKSNKLVPGQFASIELTLGTNEAAILVPTQSVVPEVNGHIVYRLKNGKAEAVSVEIGLRQASEVEILQGLTPSDTVLVTGIQQVEDGTAIEITEIN